MSHARLTVRKQLQNIALERQRVPAHRRRAAECFWLSVQKEGGNSLARHLSPAMRQLAVRNLEVARAFAAPLVAG